jgi:hypothetical protein
MGVSWRSPEKHPRTHFPDPRPSSMPDSHGEQLNHYGLVKWRKRERHYGYLIKRMLGSSPHPILTAGRFAKCRKYHRIPALKLDVRFTLDRRMVR